MKLEFQSHPSVIRAYAKFPTCEATTLTRLVRYVKRHVEFASPFRATFPLDSGKYKLECGTLKKEKYLAEIHARKFAEAEKTNKKLRSRLYSKFLRPATSIAGVMQRAEEYNELIVAGKHPFVPKENAAFLLCSPHDVDFFKHLKINVCMRGVNWCIVSTFLPTHVYHRDGETLWKHGRPVRYTQAINQTRIRSFALIGKNGVLSVVLDKFKYTLPAPAGYAWKRDANGIKLVDTKNQSNDYHPDAKECFCAQKDNCAAIISAITKNVELRQQEKARLAAEIADMEGVYVCLADSLRGGNCRTGSCAFASRAGLDTRNHVSADALLDAALKVGENMGRVRLAISQAIRRHRREVAQGFSLLAEHVA